MASRRPPGTPGRLVRWFRDFLRGSPVENKPWLRTTKIVATRSPDKPNIPDGVNHKLSDNYYYTYDMRRAVQPPTVVPSLQRIADHSSDAVSSEEVAYPQLSTPPVPGLGHR